MMVVMLSRLWCLRQHIGDVMSKATDKVKGIVNQGEQAVEGIKDMALDTFEAAAAKVNQSLKVVGQLSWKYRHFFFVLRFFSFTV